jgi:hypothetical protein
MPQDAEEPVPFQNRVDELKKISDPPVASLVLDIYGEAGIGKSRLLMEARERCRQAGRTVLLIDLNVADPGDLTGLVTKALVEVPEPLRIGWAGPEDAAARIVRWLAEAAQVKEPAYLMLDTTEHLQNEDAFWRWLEANLIAPLLVQNKARVLVVCAGRMPAPWRRFEVRRRVSTLALQPLPPGAGAEDLLQAALQPCRGVLTDEEWSALLAMLSDLAFGHPRLSLDLTQYCTSSLKAGLSAALADPDALRHTLCRNVVAPTARDYFYQGLDPTWIAALEWASVLRQFDAQLLREYVEACDPDLTVCHNELDFVTGLMELRSRHALIWQAGSGYTVHGVLGQIIRRNMQILEPERYGTACRAAAALFSRMAKQSQPRSPDRQRYRETAREYEQEAASYPAGDAPHLSRG